MRPAHSYVIRVSRAPADTGWFIQMPGVDSALAATIPAAVKLALVTHVERLAEFGGREARVFVTVEIEPEVINDVIAGKII